jgi:hypothetical protein
MRDIVVDITISADEYLKSYRHSGAVVTTRCRLGRRVQFPANILQRFVSHAGISGSFRICFNDAGKFVSVERL